MLTRIRLTLKQHRFETIAIVVVSLGVAVAALIEAYRISSLGVPLSCFSGTYDYSGNGPGIYSAGAHCQLLMDSFNGLRWGLDANLVQLLLVLVPLLAGIVLGAPLVARELEQGTAPLSWALSGSRRRWLLGKVLAGVVLLVPTMLAVGLAADVLEGALDPGVNINAVFQNYLSRGFIDVFWALAAFAGTFALGTLFGRTMPALIVALIVCFFVRVTWEPGMARIVLAPMAVEQTGSNQQFGPMYFGPGGGVVIAPIFSAEPSGSPGPLGSSASPDPGASPKASGSPAPGDSGNQVTAFTPYWVQIDLDSYTRVFLDGKPYQGDPYSLGGYNVQFDANGNPIPPDPSTVPQWIRYSIPGSQYWLVVAIESGLLLLGSLLFAAVALVWVDRRRPY